jgi:hypothetical protein
LVLRVFFLFVAVSRHEAEHTGGDVVAIFVEEAKFGFEAFNERPRSRCQDAQ